MPAIAMISAGAPLLTRINVFTVAPENQQRLLEILQHDTDETFRRLPGLVSLSLHRSLDGTKVANYVQRERLAPSETVRFDPSVLPHFKAVTALATVEPGEYKVESVHHTRSATSMITADAPLMTLINVFTVAPENQQRLLKILQEATELISRLPGFISANLHRGLDGAKVANYAQWESRTAFEAFLADPATEPHFARIRAIALAAPATYEVVSVHRA
ncbi:MAG: antibiotic biosynthesis monooxygenase family protein [Egibacteraceae bacterium]